MKKFLCAALFSVAASSALLSNSSSAAPATANQLLAWCQSENEEHNAVCMGFLIALENFAKAAFNGTRTLACMPRNTSNQELRDLVVLVLESVSDRQNDNAAVVAMEALASAFPCPSAARIGQR